MNRRNFLKGMLGLIAISAIDPLKIIPGLSKNVPKIQTVIIANEYLTVEDFAERFLRPAVEALAKKIDEEMLSLYYST